MKKFKFKYVIIGLILLFIGTYLYQNYIYYQIPRNPISNLDLGVPTDIYYMEYSDKSNIDDVIKGHSKNRQNSELILKYLSELDLVPIKEIDEINGKEYHFNYMLKFDTQSDFDLFIDYISSEDLTILNITANQPILRNSGYYEIKGADFDYNYINNLIDGLQK